jgi:uncharacterized protein (TIGR03083 family)
MDIDFGQAYRFAREEIARLVEGRDDTAIVSATPLWSVHDVVAHLAGVVEDGRIGNFEGAPGDAWTAAQVQRGRDKTTAQLLAEWADGAPSLEEALTAGTGPWHSTLDVVTHLCDLANAVGVPANLPPGYLEVVSPRLQQGFESGIVSEGFEPLTLRASNVEIFRARFGRRTREEVRAMSWSRDPEDCLDRYFIFGVATASLHELPPAN